MIWVYDRHSVGEIWPEALPYIERVLAKFDYGSSADDILADIALGERQLWRIDGKGYAVTSISRLPQFSVLDVSLVAGDDMDEWLDEFVEAMTEFGKLNNCRYIDGFGRRGWTRKLEGYGFKPYSYDVRKRIDGR